MRGGGVAYPAAGGGGASGTSRRSAACGVRLRLRPAGGERVGGAGGGSCEADPPAAARTLDEESGKRCATCS